MDDLELAKKYLSKARSSKDRGIEFSLSLKRYRQLMLTKRCFYTGIVLTKPEGDKRKFSDLTIDRVDCNEGYTDSNSVACCNGINQLKSQWEDPNSELTVDHVYRAAKKTKEKLKNVKKKKIKQPETEDQGD